MMDRARQELLALLREAGTLLALPDNDFAWSSWDDAKDALQELDGLIATLEAGALPARSSLEILFAPTGPIQEVSLSSGWGDAFLAFADRFDAIIGQVYKS